MDKHDEVLERASATLRRVQQKKHLVVSDAKNSLHELESAAGDAITVAVEFRRERNTAYHERNRMVAAMARMTIDAGGRAGLKKTTIEGWDEAWQNCIYIDGPFGQLSFHFHDNEASLFRSFPAYDGTWNGHTTAQKFKDLDKYANREIDRAPAPLVPVEHVPFVEEKFVDTTKEPVEETATPPAAYDPDSVL